MAIRGSISKKPSSAENVYNGSPVGRVNINDRRGTADPNKDPYEGSTLGKMGVPQEHARSIIMDIANREHDGIGNPKELPVQDVLSFVRMGYNPGWGAEYRYRQRVRSPLTAVRGFCVVTCKAGSAKEASECDEMSCPLWAMRLGKNGHFGKKS